MKRRKEMYKMMGNDTNEYVRKDIFDVSMHNINTSIERMGQDISRQASAINNLSGEVKALNARVEGVIDTFSVAISGLNSRIDDMKGEQSQALTKWGIIVAVVVGVVQVLIAVVLNFWR